MGRGIQWDGDAWEDYCEWQKDKPTPETHQRPYQRYQAEPVRGHRQTRATKT